MKMKMKKDHIDMTQIDLVLVMDKMCLSMMMLICIK